MKQWMIVAAVGMLALHSPPASASERQVNVVAKNWAFTPSTITLHLKQKTKLVFSASEGMHGITIPDLGVNNVVNIGPTPTSVEVTPRKLGTFVARCAVFCGIGHAKMILRIKVVK